ncbi:hypothetical protein FZEAL_7799 [Fusarium zealandicum]|uniref:WLM domain-containing protein n=1 Tax=Fusarium zealandicum TaxID=1053134 RepID=A0A8H4UFV8_9HYPO|nr:hypothetical protein FZEAL_7799 [Fusarium zealandicum]
MVAGYQRLNDKKSQPNPNIAFIKPLEGPDKKTAQDFLERIAAQCRPIMRENHVYVTSLEEYEPNREFVGRNFNAGEVVQLVLKSPSTGRWLPFNYVQMVMMHELAHCKQMNHSRAFWAVRDGYASEMHALWSKSYTGDGLWGRGANLATGAWERNTVLADDILPEHLCGGTFRSRRKRKAKPQLSYQERKERRILKKFGKNGVALGADDETKVKLESGRKIQAKPRVAGSMRGRELRAAAALARFEQQKVEPEPLKDDDDTESGSDSDYEDEMGVDSKDALDVDGTRLVDGQGRGMVKVCEDEDTSGPSARDETKELQNMIRGIKRESPEPQAPISVGRAKKQGSDNGVDNPSVKTPVIRVKPEPTDKPQGIERSAISTSNDEGSSNKRATAIESHQGSAPRSTTPQASSGPRQPEKIPDGICSMCSFANPSLALTCACASWNVLQHDDFIAQLSICDGMPSSVDRCQGTPTTTTGEVRTALFAVAATEDGVSIAVHKEH